MASSDAMHRRSINNFESFRGVGEKSSRTVSNLRPEFKLILVTACEMHKTGMIILFCYNINMDRVELEKKPIWRYFSQAQKT